MAEETATTPAVETAPPTLATSAIFRLCEELIALREQNSRQHKLFEQAQARTRDDLQGAFNAFAADTQRAYQQLRQEFSGEKRVSLALLNELLDLAEDVQTIADARPDLEGANEAIVGWAGAIDVQARKALAALERHGIHPFDAVLGGPYDPAIHERVGGRRVEGVDPYRVVEQSQRGYASRQPEFVLRRPKVIVSE